MNEITRIHLGRQPFTVSVEAHKELKSYLAAIEKQVGDKDVVQEVELRMAELLAERGVTGDKVILPADIEYLKGQLGNPDDFGDNEDGPETPIAEDKATKRLFRDTDSAIVAGVASGVANYFGLDATLVRLVFVLLVIFSAGFGIILYLLLWLIVPPAETTSEKLQMQGKPVTLDALKDSVSKADVAGTARRVNSTVLTFLNGVFRVGFKLVGIGFMLAGLGLLVGAAIVKMYTVLHNGQLFQENIFPVGVREEWLLTLGLVLAAIAAMFLILTGIATIKRKWPVRGWITGLLAGLFLVGSVATAALAADAAPRINQRYEAGLHTTAVKDIQPFSKVQVNGIDVSYVSSPTYAVNLHYFGQPDLSKIKVHVANDTLYVDASALDTTDHCTMLCLFPKYDLTVQVYAPNVQDFKAPPHTDIFYPAPPALN
ncbi:MAG TPA: PspC domain-containing protein [Candidatus Saccharimonadales bacterium]|nr:PspC domain-containing protein [Candidatus Saccharimonadales bacterium]